MLRFTLVLVVCLGAAFASAAQLAPRWARDAGLDFWNLEHEETELDDASSERQILNTKFASRGSRHQTAERIATRLAQGQLAQTEAVDEMAALFAGDPEWLTSVRCNYSGSEWIPLVATDRDVATCYLLNKIESLFPTARVADEKQAAELAARRNRLDEELRLLTLRLNESSRYAGADPRPSR